MLTRLIFFSERQCDDAALAAMISHASAANKARDVAGLIMADAQCFIQALEGPRSSVSAIFHDICRDARHHNVQLVEMTELAQRTLPLCGLARITDTEKIEAAWSRLSIGRMTPWPMNALQIRGLLRIALGDAVAA